MPSTRGRPRDPELTNRRRAEILDTAATMFAEHGFPWTEVQQVADRLQIGKGTIYRYFPSKEELFLAAVDRGLNLLHDCIVQATEGLNDPLDLVEAGIRAYLEFFRDHPQIVEIILQERAVMRDRRTPTYVLHHESRVKRWQAFFDEFIAAGRVRELPSEQITTVLSDLVFGTMVTNHYARRHRSVDTQAREIAEIVLHGILSPTERRRHRLRHSERAGS